MAKDKKKKKDTKEVVSFKVPDYAITEKGLKNEIEKAIKSGGHLSAMEWSKEVGVTNQVVSAFMRGVQPAGLKLPEALGYKPQIVFIPMDAEPIATAYPPRRATANPTSKTDSTKEPIEKKGIPKKTATELKDELKAKLKERHQAPKKDKKKKKKK